MHVFIFMRINDDDDDDDELVSTVDKILTSIARRAGRLRQQSFFYLSLRL